MSSHWLENLSWASQVVLIFVATFATVAAFVQVRTTKLFELLKYLESPELRRSRRIVFREIYPRKHEKWWDDVKDGERLEAAASDVCASYDILGKIIEYDKFERLWPSYGRFFTHYWARSIVDNHDALESFLRYRRERVPNAYSTFSTVAEAARTAKPVKDQKLQAK
jgi:hypothetical protein